MGLNDETNQTSPGSARVHASRIGDLLIERGLVTDEQIEQALAYQKEHRPNKLLGRVIVELNFITAEDLIETMAVSAGVPFLRIDPQEIDPNAVSLLPRPFIDKNNILPLSWTDGQLSVAVEDFTNIFLIEDIERLMECDVRIVAATGTNIHDVIESLEDAKEEELAFSDILDDMHGEGEITIIEQQHEDLADLQNAASDSPVIKLVNYIIHGAVRERASDIHIEPDQQLFRVRYRVDGDLYEKTKPPFSMLSAVVSRIKIMAGMDIAERRIPQDGNITVVFDKRSIDLRVSTMPTKFGEKVVIRVIDNKNTKLDLGTLGFPPVMLERIRQLLAEPNGVILVTGPTGSGKSTTLYGSLSEIVNPAVNVSTVEDPIENNLMGVNQFQVNTKAGFTFAGALRALLRQDPDVIMVGEIRDTETAQIATQAALTGHMVLSTLHTNDAPSAVIRLINMGVEPYLVAASLQGVIAQRLIRKICTHCKEQATLTDSMHRTLTQMFGNTLPIETFYKGKGCNRCRNSGYSGRVGIYEMFIPEDDVLEAISVGAPTQELRRLARANGGYTTLREDGVEKVKQGITSIEALLDVVARKNESSQNDQKKDDPDWHTYSRADD